MVGLDDRGRAVRVDARGHTQADNVGADLVATPNQRDFFSLSGRTIARRDVALAIVSKAHVAPAAALVTMTGVSALDLDLLAAYRTDPAGLDLTFVTSTGIIRSHGSVRLPGKPGDATKHVSCVGSGEGLTCAYVAGDAKLHEEVYLPRILPPTK